MNNYDTYTKIATNNHLSFEECINILSELNICVSQIQADDKINFYNDFLKKAFDYAYIRACWEIKSNQEKMDDDNYRTACHNQVITALNVLSRLANQEGIDTYWRDELGDDRKRIGDFTCFVAYVNGICNR